jgi:hypothetical protein
MCHPLDPVSPAPKCVNTPGVRNNFDGTIAPDWNLLNDEDDNSLTITHPSVIDQAVRSGQWHRPTNLNPIQHEIFNYHRIRSSTPVPEFDPFHTPYHGWARPSTKIQDDDVALAGKATQFDTKMPNIGNQFEKVSEGKGRIVKETKTKTKRFKKTKKKKRSKETGRARFGGERGLLATLCKS